jgi:Mitochondrial 39-S ribosomal protein L47 (MRP-L47)
MTLPEDLDAHGRAWSGLELANKDWDDLWKIWWKCVRERNWLSSDAAERRRMNAGYGDGEFMERDAQVNVPKIFFGMIRVCFGVGELMEAWEPLHFHRVGLEGGFSQ